MLDSIKTTSIDRVNRVNSIDRTYCWTHRRYYLIYFSSE